MKTLLCGLAAISLLTLSAAHPAEMRCPDSNAIASAAVTVGAIRWDAWYDGSDGYTQRTVRATLAPPRFHYRLPWFATLSPSGVPRLDGNNQAVIDKEIQIASTHGVNYWAFVYYPDDPMQTALQMYLKSRKKSLVKFSLIDSPGWGATMGSFQRHIGKRIDLMADPQWQRVLDGRPLYFLSIPPPSKFDEWVGRFWDGKVDNMKKALDWLRSQSELRGLGNPYVVGVGTALPHTAQVSTALGLDAISSYEVTGGDVGAPYARLVAINQGYWNAEASTGMAVVPNVMLGWDPTPRLLHGDKGEGRSTYTAGSPAAIAENITASLDWVSSHSAVSPAKTALVYSWNEYDEGGSTLNPSFVSGNPEGDASVIDAVGKALAFAREGKVTCEQNGYSKISQNGSKRQYNRAGRLEEIVAGNGGKIVYLADGSWERYSSQKVRTEHTGKDGTRWTLDATGKALLFTPNGNGIPQLSQATRPTTPDLNPRLEQ